MSCPVCQQRTCLKMTAGGGSCPSSFPSGNQVDGLPLVAYQNRSEAGQTGRLHADTLDHEKIVFRDDCFMKGAWEFNDFCEAHIGS